jgi:hypothetical protein
MDKVEAIEAIKATMLSYLFSECQPDRGDVFSWCDDHADALATAALTAAEPFFELAANLNECIAELGDDEPFVVQRGPAGWEVRKMTAWKVLNPEVFADVRKEVIEEAAKAMENLCFFTPVDELLGMTKQEMSVRTCHAGAAAIRALSDPPVLDEVVDTTEVQGNPRDDLR